jgi:urease subunit alpha
LSKQQMARNTALPRIEVDPETYEVRVDGELATCEPATRLSHAQLYYIV